MSDIKLFRLTNGKASELRGDASDLEKPLQTLIENNLGALLNIRFLATEYSTGKTHAGRIDSLGIDENDCPVIFEYKRSTGENVINQGLFYLDWLMDHRAEFTLLVMQKLGQSAADGIDWTAPRLVCIAADFTKYDGHAVQQINRNIELIRYRRFGNDLLLLELVNAASSPVARPRAASKGKPAKASLPDPPATPHGGDKPFSERLVSLTPNMAELLETLDGYILSLGDDVQSKDLRLYRAYKRLRNFATIVLQKSGILLYLHLDPAALTGLPAFARDVRNVGHWGTGDLELRIQSLADIDSAKPLILAAYEGRSGAESLAAS